MIQLKSKKGITLLEALITIIIASIAFFALAMPFIAERSFWSSGERQVAAQRDAQLVTRAIARVARESDNYLIDNTAGYPQILFDRFCGDNSSFQGGPTLGTGRLDFTNTCVSPTQTYSLIDGVKSKVTQFAVTQINAKLFKVRINVLHENETNELLETQIYLRNA